MDKIPIKVSQCYFLLPVLILMTNYNHCSDLDTYKPPKHPNMQITWAPQSNWTQSATARTNECLQFEFTWRRQQHLLVKTPNQMSSSWHETSSSSSLSSQRPEVTFDLSAGDYRKAKQHVRCVSSPHMTLFFFIYNHFDSTYSDVIDSQHMLFCPNLKSFLLNYWTILNWGECDKTEQIFSNFKST